MSSKEAVTRWMSKARKYQAQLEERRHLQQLLAGMSGGQQESLMRFKDLLRVPFFTLKLWLCQPDEKCLPPASLSQICLVLS